MNSANQSDTAKQQFQRYADLLRENSRQIQRLDNLTVMESTDSSAGARALELDQVIRDGITVEQETGARLEGLICQLPRADERAVLRMRYFDLAEWPDIRSSLYGDKPDFLQREQSYSRRLFRLHTSALATLNRLLASGESSG